MEDIDADDNAKKTCQISETWENGIILPSKADKFHYD